MVGRRLGGFTREWVRLAAQGWGRVALGAWSLGKVPGQYPDRSRHKACARTEQARARTTPELEFTL